MNSPNRPSHPHGFPGPSRHPTFSVSRKVSKNVRAAFLFRELGARYSILFELEDRSRGGRAKSPKIEEEHDAIISTARLIPAKQPDLSPNQLLRAVKRMLSELATTDEIAKRASTKSDRQIRRIMKDAGVMD
ncbi:MAG: hypothetical protein JRS35_22225 [Deltaproteobacteria bacterium]|nr:hypothetical protein [Deltaproteobacteria bacterium]